VSASETASRGVFLNVDAGELPDEPEALYELADLVSIAAGGHAGDVSSVRASVARARRHGAAVGVHPSFDDREGFGRRALVVSPATLRAAVVRQCALVRDEARAQGAQVVAMKPHGALYHAANRDEALALAVIEATAEVLSDVLVVGPATGALRDAATVRGLRFAAEGFADRGYDENGQLRPRGAAGALLTAPTDAAAQAEALAARGAFDTLCVHGDSPGAAGVLAEVRRRLVATGHWRSFPTR
jgi:5-oxoprolinase (ATP-hydrolysing) subunit A